MSFLDQFNSRRAGLERRGGQEGEASPATTTSSETRAPKAATQHVTWQSVGRPMIAEWDAASAVRLAYYANVFVYRCVQTRANSVARLPVRVGADPDKPNDHNPNAPLLRALTRNPALSWRQLVVQASAQYDVTGRFAWELELDRAGVPMRAWPLISAYLDPIPTSSGDSFWERFEYRTTSPTGDRIKKLTADQVLYAWRPSLENFRQPESLLQAQRLNVSVAVMHDRYTYAFLLNDARPATAVVTQAFAEEGQFEAFKRQWSGTFGGPDNAGKPVFIEADSGTDGSVDASKWLNVQSLGMTQRDAQALQMYERELKNITVGFGVPVSMLGDSSDRTFSNSEQEAQNYWEATMLPHLAELEDHLNRQLAPRFGSDVLWFDTSGVAALKPPSKYQQVNLSDLVGRVVTVNEARAEVGLPAISGGDQLQAPVAPPAPEEPEGGGRTDGPEPDRIPPSGEDADRARIAPRARRRPPVRHPEPDDHEARRTRLWTQADQRMVTLERQFRRGFQRLFTRQADVTLERLTGKRGRKQVETRAVATNFFDPGYWAKETAELVTGLLESVVSAGGWRVADQVGVRFDLDSPTVQDFIRQRASVLADRVTATTYAAIRDQLAEGVGQGEGIDQLAGRVRGVFADADRTRSETIARTEVIGAYNTSATLVAEREGVGIIGGKEWIATPDSRTRLDHRSADGRVALMGQPFLIGGASMQHPHDPAGPAGQVVNCRCTLGFLTPEEMAERTAEASVELRAALHVIGLVAAGLINPEQVPRALEIAA